ncbi:glycosyltransferase, group 2 family protein [Streptococcus parasanguinis ATCC 903]|uniref:Glycosyltransferase n=1 Tax=Streptococcus parasanguinis TaxID=1318 RepID=A0AAX4AYT7_STRPA|nr:glycosyltransferase [Streptococcus parasanguinis]EFX38341.1 glycosyltransferase, group 2 family protein [Streptococcus parasanguinis ATCC 903]WNB83807.1 glycosyltransferase [Streptococcus parasanguinis]
MKPLLTVVIPVYNVERYLKRCIESVLAQEWKDYEIILVDDGSTDHSPQICDDYVKAYDFISVIHKENGGLSEARNTGISHAKGEYVYFPDSDDWIEPDTFIALAEALESQDFDIISFNREFVKGEEDAIVSEPEVTQVFEGKDAFVQMLKHTYITGFANDKIYRKSLFIDNNILFPSRKYYEDLGTNYKLFLSAQKVYATNQKYYHYLIDNPDSITQSWNEKKFRDMFGFYKEMFYSDFVRSQLNQEELHLSQLYYVNGLTHILASLYKAKLHKHYGEITSEVKQELEKNKVAYSEVKSMPNRSKYLLYRLHLLKLAFAIQGMK